MHVTSAMMKRKNIRMSGLSAWFVAGAHGSRITNPRSVGSVMEDWSGRRAAEDSGRVGRGRGIKLR